MGWGSGKQLFRNIWNIIRIEVPAYRRKELGKKLVKEFEMEDCDFDNSDFQDFPELKDIYENSD